MAPIKTKKEGMTVITAVADNKEASCNVSVYTPINATSGTLAQKYIIICRGK